jgi:hypothetical protein
LILSPPDAKLDPDDAEEKLLPNDDVFVGKWALLIAS